MSRHMMYRKTLREDDFMETISRIWLKLAKYSWTTMVHCANGCLWFSCPERYCLLKKCSLGDRILILQNFCYMNVSYLFNRTK